MNSEDEKTIQKKLTTFQKMNQKMVAANPGAYRFPNAIPIARPHIEYTKEDALDIIHNGDPEELRRLSFSFFYTSGFYRRMILYYSTILTYSTLVIPNFKSNKDSLSTQEKNLYDKALDIIENLNPKSICVHMALHVFVEGAYYGMLSESSDGKFTVIDLPYSYCRHRYKTYEGIDIIDFNLTFFDKIPTIDQRIACLKTYPDEIRIAYNNYKNKGLSYWYQVPAEYGIHFNLYEDRPFLVDTIPAIIDFNEYRDIEKEKDKQDLYKILVQEMPHLNDGELVFEPEEVALMHEGVVKMLKNTKGIDVLTSFGNVDVKDLQAARSVISNNLEKIEKSIYSEAGVSKQLFSADTTTSLNKALDNDCALVMILGNYFANWFKFIINNNCSKYNAFEVIMLPVTQFNRIDMFKTSLQGAQNGYSIFIPSICLGISQKQLINLKKLENALDLLDYMTPLASSFTQTGETETENKTTKEAGKAQADISNENNNNKKTDDAKADDTLRKQNSGG